LIGFRPPAPREVRIAGLPGSTVEQMNARRKVALEFYKTMGRVWDGDLKALREYVLPDELRAILDHITGIDFRQPLKVGPPPPMPAKQSQWQVPNGPKGQYFAAAGTNPVNLGIGPVGQLKKDTPIEKKISTDYAIPMGTPYLQSIASAKTDTWSIKSGTNRNQPTKGGAIQYYVGDTAPINAIGPTPDASR